MHIINIIEDIKKIFNFKNFCRFNDFCYQKWKNIKKIIEKSNQYIVKNIIKNNVTTCSSNSSTFDQKVDIQKKI